MILQRFPLFGSQSSFDVLNNATMVSSQNATLRTNSMSVSGNQNGDGENSLNETLSDSLTNRTATSDVESNLGTLIINDEDNDDLDGTLKPAFLAHFEMKENMVSH